MKYQQNLKHMANTKGFSSFDPQTDYNDADMILDAISEKTAVWVVHNAPWNRIKNRGYSDEEMLKKCIDISEGKCGLEILVFADTEDETLRLADKIKNYADRKGRLA
jgi:hypothetical protein